MRVKLEMTDIEAQTVLRALEFLQRLDADKNNDAGFAFVHGEDRSIKAAVRRFKEALSDVKSYHA
jgi:hypothetical protein